MTATGSIAGRRFVAAVALLALLAFPLRAAVWQFSTTVGSVSNRARLFIPPTCERVRAVVIALDNLAEKPLLESPVIRQAAAAENLALVWIERTSRGRVFDKGFKPEADDALLDEMLSALAHESGYAEIATAPLLPVGHSAGVPFAWELAKAHPDRMLGVIPFKSWLPEKADMKKATRVPSVPVLVVKGQFEEWSPPGGPTDREASWRAVRENTKSLRAQSDRNLAGFLFDAGGGHFECGDELARVLAMFIRKAAQRRIVDGSNALAVISPLDGWVTDMAVGDEARFPLVASHRELCALWSQLFWYFDREMATAVRKFGEAQRGKAAQMVTFATNGAAVPLSKRGIVELPFQPLEDGRTFKLGGAFFDAVPAGVLPPAGPLGRGDGPIRVEVVKGPAIATGPDTFRVQFDGSGFLPEIWLLASHAGDARHRRAVQAGLVTLPSRITAGKPQRVIFPEIPDQPADATELTLNATCDSGLPVEYFVENGPAEVGGNTLRFTPLPPRARHPVAVTVVAHQWGRSIAPLHQSAEPVRRTFHLRK
jgi:hypothetical protein